MLVTHEKEKLIEAASYFVSNTKHCGLIKLFKLLYWLDYHHFRETGRSVTGLEYHAFPRGPVPSSLYDEMKKGEGDIASNFNIQPSHEVSVSAPSFALDSEPPQYRKSTYAPTSIKPKRRFGHRFLTRRELRIASELAEIFVDAPAELISDVSHAKGGPWQYTLQRYGERAPISFVESPLFPVKKGNYLPEDEVTEAARDYEELKRALS